MKVELYSKPNCGYCVQAKLLLEKKAIDYTLIDISQGDAKTQSETREGLIERVASAGHEAKTMPQIFVDGGYVGGYDQLVADLRDVTLAE